MLRMYPNAVVNERCGETVRGIFHGGVALVIEESDAKARVDRGLIRVRGGPVHLVQAEAGKQRGFVGDAVIDAHGKLIGVGDDLGRCGVSARAVGSLRDRWASG